MGVFHRATITPSKAELIAEWAPTQSWGPAPGSPLDVVGAFRFDDPENHVGMETHMASCNGTLFQIPVTYRDTPVPGAEAALICEMEHSELGTRWVYDALADPLYVTMLAAAAMTGQGEALGMAVYDGRWHIAPANVRIQGGGWTLERVPVDAFQLVSDDEESVMFNNDRFALTFFRRVRPGPGPDIGLTAVWEGQDEPVVLAEVTEL